MIAQTAEDFDLYRFNQSATQEWENWKQTGEHYHFNLEEGRGYLYANRNTVTLKFWGTMNTADSKEVALDYDANARLKGWNLVGNPFTVAAYIDKPYYKMNEDGTDVTPVVNYDETPVEAMSGVMVHATSTNQTVTFTTSPSRSSGNSSLEITLSKAGVRGEEIHDKAIVSFGKNAQLGKFIFNEEHAKLYIPQEGEDYAIAYSNRAGEMPVCFKASEMGQYTISFSGDTQGAKLIDKIDNNTIDLSENEQYSFIGSPSDIKDRFILVFGVTGNEPFAYQDGEGIVVNGDGELQVFDVMGRMVARYNVNGVETVSKPSQTGVYILRIVGKEIRVQKIVVR